MEILTTCTMDCPDRCSILCRVNGDEIQLRGNPEHPYTKGFVCRKIGRHPRRLRSLSRIRKPHVRKGTGFVPVSWDDALDTVCEAIDRARDVDPASMLLIRGGGSFGISKGFANYLFGLLGARNVRGSLCHAAGLAALGEDAGGLDMNDPAQIDHADRIVLWGKHPKACSVHTAVQVAQARKRGTPVLAINPDVSSVESIADRVISVNPGTDRFLALAVAKLLLEQGKGTEQLNQAANGAAFNLWLRSLDSNALLDACGVGEADGRALAQFYSNGARVATLVGWGLQRYPSGGENVRAIHALAFLAGSLGVPGGGLYYAISPFRHVRFPRTGRSRPPAMSLPAIGPALEDASPPVRFAWVSCSNILNQGPGAARNRTAFEKIETSVVVDGFWTETARKAAIVLPSALWLEEEDVAGSYWHNILGAVRKAVDPPEGCRSDFEILREMATRLSVDVPFDTVDDWLETCLPTNKGVPNLAELRTRGWAVLDWPKIAWTRGFGHPDGRFRLIASVSPERKPDPDYALRLLALIREDAIHSQILPEDQTVPLSFRIHPDAAGSRGIADGDKVRVVSREGAIEGNARLDPGVHPGGVICPRGGWIEHGQGVNLVVPTCVTDLGENAAFYGTGVQVEWA